MGKAQAKIRKKATELRDAVRASGNLTLSNQIHNLLYFAAQDDAIALEKLEALVEENR